MTTRQKKRYDLYVDDKHVKTINSAWYMNMIMTWMQKKYPDAMRLEVKLCEDVDMSSFILKGQGKFGEDVRI